MPDQASKELMIDGSYIEDGDRILHGVGVPSLMPVKESSSHVSTMK